MAAAPHHLLASTSSLWAEDEVCPSTLRARLRDDETPATSSSVKPIPYQNVYQQVHACLGSHLRAPKPEVKVVQAPESHDPATQLQEAYARMGMKLHSSAIEHLVRAHSEVQSKTMHFSNESSKTLSQCKELYANIAYPLSATLCHSDNHHRNSIVSHLQGLKQDIAAAKEEILRLGDEWDACCRTEADAWKALNKGLDNRGWGPNEIDKETVEAADAFKAEAEAIVEDKCRMLGEIEKEFKAEIHAETLRMMQNLFVDE
ncbi:hypothetical protein FSARC_12497 [Fusarium sarcochroum]|uniref:Uncharacterized protein n=1 Tax=Fusarium sarcochroum TaxID=1208366 RepID=A0A8H4T7Y4_9HYPO|nr:hypothetical protein FSARC_12497 [Fusarium sarcochroum]